MHRWNLSFIQVWEGEGGGGRRGAGHRWNLSFIQVGMNGGEEVAHWQAAGSELSFNQ